MREKTGLNAADLPGAGAAGGLGFGLAGFMNAQLTPGFELFSRCAGLKEHLRRADLVITGEGAIDESTLMGKGVGDIARWCKALSIPCLGLGGRVESIPRLKRFFNGVYGLVPDETSLEKSRARPSFSLARLAARVAANWPAVQ
jgi:glycerate kinase